jgi:hypothetical protein
MMILNFDSTEFAKIVKESLREVMKERELEGSEVPTEQLLTAKDAAKLLDLTVHTIHNKANKGELPYMRRSKRIYFLRDELIEHLKAGRKRSNDEIEREAESYLNKRGGDDD